MDFSKFSDDNFDMKDWINNALQIQKDTNVPLDAHTSNLVMKLQLFIQEVSKSLEETSQIALNNIPRVLREVENIKNESTLLKSQMMVVKEDVKKIEENTAESMKMLIEVDDVKTRIQNTANALQEADNWSSLSNDVNVHFEDGDVYKVAEKLIGMQKSLQVLQGVPDYTERYRYLETLKNKLEALISTKLVKTFNEHNLDDAKYYVEIFSELDRLPQLQFYYNNCHKSSLTKTWKGIRDDPNKTIVKWLPTFYDHLLALWHREISWCGQVFPEPVQALCLLLTQTLNNLHPTIEECIKDAIHDLQDNENSLTLLIELKDITFRFTSNLQKAVQTFQGDASTSAKDLTSVVEAPFLSYLYQYSNIQQAVLMSYIDSIKLDTDDLSESTAVMVESVGNAFQVAEEALETCIKFTNGIGVAGLLDALQIYFATYFGFLDTSLHDIQTKLDHRSVTDEVSNDQWTNFQYAFKLIEMCGLLMDRMHGYQEYVCVELLKTKDTPLDTGVNYLQHARPMEWDKVVELNERINTYGVQAILPSTLDLIKRLNEHAHHFAFDIIFTHFKEKLNELPDLEIWRSSGQQAIDGELPTFSLSPLSYITHVGDSLLTLPQQLESYFNQENMALVNALKQGKIPYQANETDGVYYDHHWLESFAYGATTVYTENIMKIKILTTHSTRQLIADLDYYFNILSALEIQPSNELQAIKDLLEVKPNEFHDKVETFTLYPKITKTISQLRNIKL